MGILRQCRLPCRKNKEPKSEENSSHRHHQHHLQSESSSNASSLSSQTSLPSVPSLTSSSSFSQQQQASDHDHDHQQQHCLCLATLRVKANSCYVSSLAISGNLLYSGSSNSEIRAWSRDPTTYANDDHDHHDNVVARTGNCAAVKSVVVLGDKLFTAHQDHKIRVWKIDDYNRIATLPTFNDRFIRCFSPNNYVQVRRHKKCTWVHHVDTVSSLALSTDGSLLYSASWDRTFKIWRTSDFKCLESVNNAHDDAINAIVVSKCNDGYVYTGSADKKIKIWKRLLIKHSLVETLEKHKSAVNALALSTDGSVLYSGACDRSILVWGREVSSTGQMALKGALRGHAKAILCLTVVSDLVYSGSADNTVRIWRRLSATDYNYCCLGVLEGHRRPVKCLAAVVDSENSKGKPSGGTSFLLYSGSLDCDIKIWRIWVPVL